MKISCTQESLSQALAITGRALPGRTSTPTGKNTLLHAGPDTLRLSTAGPEMTITAWIDATAQEAGKLTVPARALADFVNSLDNGQVELDAAPVHHTLNVTSGGAQASIQGAPATEFRPAPAPEEGTTVQAEPATLRNAISRVAFAAATEESRRVLTGVLTRLKGDQFTLAAADGFRLSVDHGKLLQPAPEDAETIIPKGAANELNRLLGGCGNPVEMTIAPEGVVFRLGEDSPVELAVQPVGGTFPNYGALIPERYNTRAVLDPHATLRAIWNAAAFARDGSNIIRMTVKQHEDGRTEGGRLLISASSENVGSTEDEVDLPELEGEENRIAFNSRYLLDAISALGPGQMALEITASSNPGVFRLANSNSECVHVVMPMHVQW